MGRGPKNFQNNNIQNQKISNKHNFREWVLEIREKKMKILEKIGVGV